VPRSKGSSQRPARVVLLMPTTTYRADDFLSAADRLGVEVVLGSDRCHVLDELGAVVLPRESLVLDFRDPTASAQKIVELAAAKPVGAVLALDDATTVIAALASSELGLPNHGALGARATRDKMRMRARLAKGRVRQPRFHVLRRDEPVMNAARRIERHLGFPCVLKPRCLSASRGVIRADSPQSFTAAFARLARLLRDPDIRGRHQRAAESILVEEFVPGAEVAVEGLLTEGELTVLAIFDKPDPLDGPFFEETLYVTPSRLGADVQRGIASMVADAARALDLRNGPLHAEVRIAGDGLYLIEVAPRSIGGLCSRTLRFGTGMSLEELILRHALAMPREAARAPKAAGVIMLPIARTGMLRSVEGIEAAKAIAGVEDVVITAKVGREIVALPEGNSYLGFAFARAETPAEVEAALRAAHAALKIEISPKIPVV
jgi:biotin carboxylase